MKKYDYVFGVDVSKKTVDITLSFDQAFTHRQFSNDLDGLQRLWEWFKEIKPVFENTLFCMEATGLYCFPLTSFLTTNGIDTWVEHPTQIKKASGLTRGKNDKVDSQRIAVYATKHLERLRLWKPMDTTLEKIRHLATLRERLVETKKRLETPINEFKAMGNEAMVKLLTNPLRARLVPSTKI